jgi:CDGSH iron-sulfur domain-containing protein 3
MARIVHKEDKAPMMLEIGGEKKWICMCGLSKNQPFCDGAHKQCRDEEDGKVYQYQADGSRSET